MSGFTTNFVSPRYAAAGLAAVSVVALGAAFIAQYLFGLAPCHLCLWQRVPFAVAALAGIAGFYMNPRPFMWLMALTFAIGAALAFFHAGVEYKWWEGTNSCDYPLKGLTVEQLREAILSPKPRCDTPAWSLFGISMAGYNVGYSIILASIALYYARKP